MIVIFLYLPHSIESRCFLGNFTPVSRLQSSLIKGRIVGAGNVVGIEDLLWICFARSCQFLQLACCGAGMIMYEAQPPNLYQIVRMLSVHMK